MRIESRKHPAAATLGPLSKVGILRWCLSRLSWLSGTAILLTYVPLEMLAPQIRTKALVLNYNDEGFTE